MITKNLKTNFSDVFTNIENKHYKNWLNEDIFKAGFSEKDYYSIILPPPNVTGSLHVGHAFNHILQDIMARIAKMLNKNVLWQPGSDHAGIATQMVVERELSKNNIKKSDLSRDDFIKEIWKWKEKSGNSIVEQQKKLGESCDWSRLKFTMDDDLVEVVRDVFIKLYNDNLIFRDYRLVNWDIKFETAISNIEVNFVEKEGYLYNIKYKLDSGKNLIISTVRPETIFGDVAIMVHPNDDRYKNIVGLNCIIPICGRKIKVITDESVDVDFGSGAVKITPAHDFNDFEVGKKHNLEIINILDKKGCLNHNVNKDFVGLDRFEARKKIVKDLQDLGFIDSVEKIKHSVPIGDRSGEIIEPYLTKQWYVDAKTLSKDAIKAVKDGKTKIIPKTWEGEYFNWLENVEPWCISRQIWWGHRLPVWYGEDEKVFVAKNEEEANKLAKDFYKKDVKLRQDEDVLDTWFSSALWPFSSLGWPKENKFLDKFFPTDLVVTGHDILFFWVARMMMMSLYLTKKIPFKDIYIHALVRDKEGNKMSKSKGNVVDPLEMIKKFGADATRISLAQQATPGRDVRIDERRIEASRGFCTKIWNVARYLQISEADFNSDFKPDEVKLDINCWILARLSKSMNNIKKDISNYRIDSFSSEIYHFIWSYYCDWYLESIKPLLSSDIKESEKNEIRSTASYVFCESLKLLHPIMPFITEELWLIFKAEDDKRSSILKTNIFQPEIINYYEKNENYLDKQQKLMDFISNLRKEKHALYIDPVTIISIYPINNFAEELIESDKNKKILEKLARVKINQEMENPIEYHFQNMSFNINLTFDKESLILKLNKSQEDLSKHINNLKNNLSNKDFIKNAPANIVNKKQESLDSMVDIFDKNSSIINRLNGIN